MKYDVHLFFLMFCLSANISMAGSTEIAQGQFEAGIAAYNNTDYEEALIQFELAANVVEGFDIYFNLGNTYYKLGKIPESILYFERALKFDPANEDVRYNLRLANERIADRIEVLPKTRFSLWWENFRFGMGPDGWAWIAVSLSILSTLLLFLFAFGQSAAQRRFGFFAGLISILLLIATHSLSQSAAAFRYGKNSAVIFTDKVDVKSEPRNESNNVFVLHSGTRVDLLRSEGEWHHVSIASGGKGWIKQADLVEI